MAKQKQPTEAQKQAAAEYLKNIENVSLEPFLKNWLGMTPPYILTSNWNEIRTINGKTGKHYGIDLKTNVGTSIKAPYDCTFIYKKVQTKGAGLYVVLRYTPVSLVNLDIYFMHLSKVVPSIKNGQKLKRGEIFAYTGGAKGDKYAGTSTGPHLHLEIRYRIYWLEPRLFLSENYIVYKNTTSYYILPPGVFGTGGVNFKLFDKEESEIYLSGQQITEGNKFQLKNVKRIFKTTPEQKSEKSLFEDNAPVDFNPPLWEFTEQEKENKTEIDVSSKFAPGIWQIVKLIIDSSVQNKQVSDSTIGMQQGSLLNFINKICQEPFVEFFTDTYGNQFYMMIRKPPFDKKGWVDALEKKMYIDDNKIISLQLKHNNQDIYSWYQYVPTRDLLGIKDQSLFLPAVFFPEFAKIFGSKPYMIESNYYNWTFSGKNSEDKDNQNNGNNILYNALKDFIFVIQSTIYLPFTREGTITIIGDRRYKRGMLVGLPTGETFHIDSVNQSCTFTENGTMRTTTLNISRGMFDELMPEYTENGYFDIVDFGDFSIIEKDISNWRKYISNWKINKKAFVYFLKKRQMEYL